MNQSRFYFYLVYLLFGWILACSQTDKKSLPWNARYDFDGDLKADSVYYENTGGVHCCYKISVWLSKSKSRYSFPFQMDGGYIVFDLSKPDRFYIDDFDKDGAPEIYMHIETYNDELLPLPVEWQMQYGITSHDILIDFPNGAPRVLDFDKL